MTAASHSLSPAEAAKITRRITAVSCAVAVVLIAAKGAACWASGSVVLLASLADSCLDLVASLVTAIAVRYAASPPDAEHRFGHGKAEAMASLVQSGLVMLSALMIAREAAPGLLHPRPIAAEGLALAVMVLSLVLTLGLVMLQTRALRRVGSVAVSGDRAHYASDFLSNGVGLLGLAAAAVTGLGVFDLAAGLIGAAVLGWSGVGIFREAADQLLDRELPDDDRARILAIVAGVPDIRAVSDLRTRVSGPNLHMQLHAQFPADASLQAAHAAIIEAERRLLAEFPAADILIHADPGPAAEPHEGSFAAVKS